MPVSLVDTHAHLDDPRLRDDLAAVLKEALDHHVVQVIAIGTTADDSERVCDLAGSHRGVFATVGIQPNHVAEAKSGDFFRVESLARSGRVVGIGETGLDRYWDHTPFEDQVAAFDRHLDLAEELDLPVVIHCRNCEADIISQLGRRGRPIRGVLHSFTGTSDDATAFLELGLHLSFAGMITFQGKKNDPLRAVAAMVPIDRLLVETDSPYLRPHPHRGRTNRPCRVAVTAEFLAGLRAVSLDDLATSTTANARRLFRLGDKVVLEG